MCCNHDYFFDYFLITFQQLHFDYIIKLLKHIAELKQVLVFHITKVHVYFLQCYPLKCLHGNIAYKTGINFWINM